MIVILAVTKSDWFKSTTYVAIALTLLAIHFAIVPFSGSSVNPARSFGTALVGNPVDGLLDLHRRPTAGSDHRLAHLHGRRQGEHQPA